jgi:hypothetical protein
MSNPAHTASAETPGGHPAVVESLNHEPSTISLRGIVYFLIWFVIIAILLHLLVWWWFFVRRSAERGTDVSVTAVVQEHRLPPPEPRMQPSEFHETLPRVDLQELMKRDHDTFAKRSPSWIDPKTGAIRIPDEIVNQVVQLPHAQSAATQQTTQQK